MIITIATHKGGVGKTTTAAAIAQGIAARPRKSKALLIDADSQGTATKSVYGATCEGGGLFQLLKGKTPAVDLIETTRAGDILPCDRQIDNITLEVTQDDYDRTRMKKRIAPLTNRYDHIIIDTAPGLSACLTQSLIASDGVLIPLGADPEGVESLKMMYETIRNAQKYNHALKVLGVVFTMYDGRANLTKQYEELIARLCDGLGVPLLKTHIRRSIVVKEAHAMRQSLFEYAPKAKPTEDYRALIKELRL